MSINLLAIGVLSIFLAYKAFRQFYWDKPELVTPSGMPVAMSVGKQRSFHSMTRDASMYTLATRRLAVQNNPTPTFQKSGFTNGVVEAFFLTGLCDVPCCRVPDYIADAGNAQTEACIILDGNGGDVLDFGNANTTVCNV